MSRAELEFEDPQIGTVKLEGERACIGRAPSCQIVIDHKRISNHHAELVLVDGRWTIRDLGSTNGTFVDRRPCGSEAVRLADGARINLWEYVAVFRQAPTVRGAVTHSGAATATGRETSGPGRETRPRTIRRFAKRRLDPAVAAIVLLIAGFTGALIHLYRTEEAPRTVSAPRVPPLAEPRVGSPAAEAPSESGERRPAATPDLPAEREAERQDDPVGSPADSDEPSEGVAIDPGTVPDPAPDSSRPQNGEPAGEAPDPFAGLLESSDAGRLARLYGEHGDHPSAAAVRSRLEGQAIYCPHWGDATPESKREAILEAFPLYCQDEDRDAVDGLPFAVAVLDVVVDLKYSQDYRTALGRKVGKQRLPPHPKRVEITVSARLPDGELKRLARVDGKTRKPSELSGDGLSEDAVWRSTIRPLAVEIQEELERRRR